MTPENRKALETMADDYERDAQWMAREALSITDYERHKAHAEGAKNHHEDAAAIHAALAEIDRLNATAERLLADSEAVREVASRALSKADAGGDEAHLVGLVVDRLHETERERDAIREDNDALRERVDVLSAAEFEANSARGAAEREAAEWKAKANTLDAEMDAMLTVATDDCPHSIDTWTTCSACHRKAMVERDALRAENESLQRRLDDERMTCVVCGKMVPSGAGSIVLVTPEHCQCREEIESLRARPDGSFMNELRKQLVLDQVPHLELKITRGGVERTVKLAPGVDATPALAEVIVNLVNGMPLDAAGKVTT